MSSAVVPPEHLSARSLRLMQHRDRILRVLRVLRAQADAHVMRRDAVPLELRRRISALDATRVQIERRLDDL
jgi:hypothetical protein